MPNKPPPNNIEECRGVLVDILMNVFDMRSTVEVAESKFNEMYKLAQHDIDEYRNSCLRKLEGISRVRHIIQDDETCNAASQLSLMLDHAEWQGAYSLLLASHVFYMDSSIVDAKKQTQQSLNAYIQYKKASITQNLDDQEKVSMKMLKSMNELLSELEKISLKKISWMDSVHTDLETCQFLVGCLKELIERYQNVFPCKALQSEQKQETPEVLSDNEGPISHFSLKPSSGYRA